MYSKILKSLVLALAFGISAAQAGPAVAAESAAMPAAGMHNTHFAAMQQTRAHTAMADCCQPHGEQAGCQHCTDNGCDNGSCGSCSHCVTALMHSPFASSDSHPTYRQIPANYFLTVYQATDPRPPQA